MIQRLPELITQPARTFDYIARDGRFLAAWTLSAFFFILPMLAFVHRVGPMQLFGSTVTLLRTQPAFAQAGFDQESPENIAEALALLFEILAVVMPIVAIPLTAACLIPMVRGMGGQAGFRPLLAVTAFASVPPALGLCVTAFIAMMLRDPAKLSFDSLAPLNLGLLIPAALGKIVHNIASTLELFSAWSVYLLAHGVAAASGLGFRRVFLALAVPLILFAWLLAVLAAGL